MDRLASMSIFVKAVELGSFAAAATALDLSGPTVGKHVRSLEIRLGTRLLNRTTRRQSLTDFGRAYYERCRVILAEAEAAEALAAEQFAEPRGRLRVTMPALFGRHCVAPILFELARMHPRLQLELSFADTLTDIGDGSFDLAVRTGTLPNLAGVTTRRIARQQMVVCAAPGYLRERGHPVEVADLQRHDAIVYGRSARVGRWLFPGNEQSPDEIVPTSRLELDDMAAIADAAVAGFGLAWLPHWLIRDKIASGTLTTVLDARQPFLYDCHALWAETPYLPLKIRVAVDAMVAGLLEDMG